MLTEHKGALEQGPDGPTAAKIRVGLIQYYNRRPRFGLICKLGLMRINPSRNRAVEFNSSLTIRDISASDSRVLHREV